MEAGLMSPQKPADPWTSSVQQPLSQRSGRRRERWLIRGLLGAAILMVLASLGLTIGRDLWRIGNRRWESRAVPRAEASAENEDRLPPLPELGLPPAVIPDPVAESRPLNSPPPDSSPTTASSVAQAEVVVEPVLDGHMIEPEHFEPGPAEPAIAAAEQPDGANVEDVLLDNSAALEEDVPEPAPDVPWLASAPPRERIRYASALKRLLNLVQDGDPGDRSTAETCFAEAGRLCAQDPRLPLAYGLYLQQIGEPELAREQFEASAAAEGSGYAPALQAAAFSRLQENSIRRGWPYLVRLANVMAASTSPPQYGRAAEWLGSAAAYLESLPAESAGRSLVNLAELRDGLPPALQTAFDAGHAAVRQHLEQLQQLAKLPADEAARQVQDAMATLENQRQSLESQVETLRTDLHNDTQGLREANETEKKARGQMGLANEQRQLAREAVADLSQPRTYAYTQTTYQSVRNAQGRSQRVPVTVVRERSENSSERAARLASLQQASTMLSKLEAEMPGLKSQHDEAKNARDGLVQEVRTKTQETRRKLAAAEKELHHAERLLARLKQLAVAPEQLADRLQTPALVLDWNPPEMGERLRASFDGRAKAAK
jgi:hypothetical protein